MKIQTYCPFWTWRSYICSIVIEENIWESFLLFQDIIWHRRDGRPKVLFFWMVWLYLPKCTSLPTQNYGEQLDFWGGDIIQRTKTNVAQSFLGYLKIFLKTSVHNVELDKLIIYFVIKEILLWFVKNKTLCTNPPPPIPIKCNGPSLNLMFVCQYSTNVMLMVFWWVLLSKKDNI